MFPQMRKSPRYPHTGRQSAHCLLQNVVVMSPQCPLRGSRHFLRGLTGDLPVSLL